MDDQQDLIVNQDDFEDLCAHIRKSGIVAFDSEFVSEHTYRPELCLLQIATRERCAAVDPFEVKNLESWWKLMADEGVTVVVHGGQAEIRFCLVLGNLKPSRIIDVQLAEGLRTRSYPLGYSTLVSRVLGTRAHGRETRTDWRQRPLSPDQIAYALDDAKHLLPIWDKQRNSLTKLKRLSWAEAEFQRMVDELEAEMTREPWRKLPGIHRLSPREFAVACEISVWREREAETRNRPVRRMLRDDLIIELARRQPRSPKDLVATRDMNRSDYKRVAPDLIQCVERALAIPSAQLPEPPKPLAVEANDDEHVIGQLLGIALANRCAELNVAKGLVATSADLRHLVRWHVYHDRNGTAPRLTEGWRAEMCGDLLTDVLDGRISMRVADPESDHPLVFERKN
ncbi:MAG: ribonuclease D [Planctomycetaceae bacterium]